MSPVPKKKVRVNARVLYIFALPAALVFLIVLILGVALWWPIALLSLPLAALVVWLMWSRSDQAVLSSLSSRGLGQTEGQRVLNTVESLSLSSGIAQPGVMAIDDPACNIAVVSGRQDTIVVTTGLLETLDLMEMEGVIAHVLTKIAAGRTRYPTLAASAKPFITSAQIKQAGKWGSDVGGIESFDISGVGLTRYPPGLLSALIRIDGRSTDIAGGDSLGDAWFVPPSSHGSQLGNRIEVLQEL